MYMYFIDYLTVIVTLALKDLNIKDLAYMWIVMSMYLIEHLDH